MNTTDDKNKKLLTMPISTLLWQYALPAMGAMSASALLNILDTIFLGRGVGILAIAGLAITFPLMTLITAIAALVNVGATMQTAIQMGKGDRDQAQKIFGSSFITNTVLGILFTIIASVFLTPILTMCGASEMTLPYATDYMQIILLGTVFSFTMQGMAGQMRAVGHPRKAMLAQMLPVVINLILDPIVIFVLGWGIKGVAIATVFSQIIGWLFLLSRFISKEHFVFFTMKTLRFHKKILMDIFSIGISPFAINLCGCGIVILINRSLIEQGGENGDLYVGTYAVIQRITQLLVMLIAGLGQGMQIIASSNMAAQAFNRVRILLMRTIFYATIIMTVGYIIIAIFADNMSLLFSSDATMADICSPALRIGLCTFPFVAGQMIAVSFFQAIRLPKISMAISITRQLLFLAPLLVLMPHYFGVNGVWWSMAFADVASVTITWVMLWYQTKKLCV